jgi:hypothetical protein
MSSAVLSLVVGGMAGMIYFTHEKTFLVMSSMMSVSSASAMMDMTGRGMCESNTTRSTVLEELVRNARAPYMNGCGPHIIGRYNLLQSTVSNIPTGSFGFSLPPVDKYNSIWAPIFATQLSVTRVVRGEYCNHYKYAIKYWGSAGSGSTGATLTLQGCFEAATNFSAGAFSFGEGQCAIYRACSRPIRWGTMTSYLLGAMPELACSQPHGGVSMYRPMFKTIHAYGELLGLAPPSLEDGIYTKRVEGNWAIIGFSPAFVAFATELHHRLAAAGDDYSMPCVFIGTSCDDYTCFDQKPAVCDFTGSVHCDSGRGIVSTKIMQKRSWMESLLAAVALSHNLEIAASAFVVVAFLFLCMRREERHELHMGFAEMRSIVQGRPATNKTASADSEKALEALKHEEEALRASLESSTASEASMQAKVSTLEADVKTLKEALAKIVDKA